MNESCPTYEGVMSHVWIVMSHVWMSHVKCMNESCPTYERVMSHEWLCYIARSNVSCHTCERNAYCNTHTICVPRHPCTATHTQYVHATHTATHTQYVQHTHNMYCNTHTICTRMTRHACTLTSQRQLCADSLSLTHTRTRTHTHTYCNTHTLRTHTCTHTCTHACTHACTHTHTLQQILQHTHITHKGGEARVHHK